MLVIIVFHVSGFAEDLKRNRVKYDHHEGHVLL